MNELCLFAGGGGGLPPCYRCKSQPCQCKDGITLYHGDCRNVLPHLSDIDGCCTDPPYGLEFMGQGWDHGIPGQHFWELIGAALKPGAPLLAFGGTRTYHRLVCAIEDAGFEIRDCLMWLYASGFPKSHDVSKAIDKAAGAKREVVGMSKGQSGAIHGGGQSIGRDDPITAPATEAAKLWDGWGTALSPAWEPIVLAMKPIEETFAQNALEHGVAGINVDGGRIGTASTIVNRVGPSAELGYHGRGCQPSVTGSPSGRWPKNVIFSHHPDCVCVGTRKVKGSTLLTTHRLSESENMAMSGKNYARNPRRNYAPDGTETVEKWECVEGCPIRMLDEQSGVRQSGKMKAGTRRAAQAGPGSVCYGTYGGNATNKDTLGDSGGASRFYFVAKASGRDRGNRPEVDLPLFGEVDLGVKNKHPTVKPTELMQGLLVYLLTLIATPTGGVVVDPFAGSGSTLVAAKRLGRQAIGIEQSEEWCRTADARLRQVPPVPQSYPRANHEEVSHESDSC